MCRLLSCMLDFFGERDADLGGAEIFMKPPKILVEIGVVQAGIVLKPCMASEHLPLHGKLSGIKL